MGQPMGSSSGRLTGRPPSPAHLQCLQVGPRRQVLQLVAHKLQPREPQAAERLGHLPQPHRLQMWPHQRPQSSGQRAQTVLPL